MKRLRPHITTLTEDATIEGRFYKSITVTDGHTLTIKGDSYYPATVVCPIVVKEGGTLIINECSSITHVCVEGGKVIVKGKCLYLYHKGGEVGIDGGSVNWLEFKNMLDGGYDGKRNVDVRNGRIGFFTADTSGTINLLRSTIEHAELYANYAINLTESKIKSGIIDNFSALIYIGSGSQVGPDVRLAEEVFTLDVRSSTLPMDLRTAREIYRHDKKKRK